MRIMKIHRKRNFLKINNRELQFEREYDSDCSIYKDSQSTDSDSEDEQNMLYVWNKWFTKTIEIEIEQGMEIDEVNMFMITTYWKLASIIKQNHI